MKTRGPGTSQEVCPAKLPSRLFPLVCVMLTVGFAGCARVNQLTVAPTTVCAGESVNVFLARMRDDDITGNLHRSFPGHGPQSRSNQPLRRQWRSARDLDQSRRLCASAEVSLGAQRRTCRHLERNGAHRILDHTDLKTW